MNSLIELTNATGADVSVFPDALILRSDALVLSRAVTAVATPADQDACVIALRAVNGLSKRIEGDRVSVKAPVIELERKIDATAKRFRVDLDSESIRLNGLLTRYQKAERDKAAALERARQAEIARLAELQRKTEQAAREKAEAAARAERDAQNARTAAIQNPELLKAAPVNTGALFQKAELAALGADLVARKLNAVVATGPVVAPKAAGMAVTERWTFEVTDLHALYAARKDLVQLEAKTADINAALRSGLRECPGLRIYQVIKANVRG